MTDDSKISRIGEQIDAIEEMKGAHSLGQSVLVEGRAIPHLAMVDTGAEIDIYVDGRFCVPFPRDLAPSAAWLLGQAIAVASGYKHLGAESKDAPFAPQVGAIGEIESGEVVPFGGEGE